MAITIVKKNDQVAGGFDSGRIEENKPIGFPQEGGKLTSFSNLFYWSHAWSVPGGLIGEHPHKGFEIISYVLKGNLEHFDNGQNSWVPLEEGDLQIIRAGNGIRHAERFLKDSAIFQIWLDPDLSKTLQKPASYNDYRHDDFPVSIGQGIKEKILIGPSSPVTLDTPGILMKDMTLAYKVHG
ncbi:MAG: pirin family protein, partial [Bacteroidota bacterium]